MPSRSLLAASLPLLLPLAACDHHGEGTSISINGTDGNTVVAANGKTGEVQVNLPGFQGKMNLPTIQLGAEQFDMNGVHLYPDSTIQSLNVARSGKKADVRIAFTSPASPQTVRDWLGQRLGKAGFALSASGDGLVGTTDEGKPFRLDLRPAGTGRASGLITITG